MTMTSSMMPAVTYVPWVRRWLRRLIRARKCLHKWSTWCQQRSMRCYMTKRDLRIRCFPFVRFLSTGSAPSLMRLRHFNLSRVSSFQFNCRLQNCPYFCVFKHARAVKQEVWNEAENRERDWGETLKIVVFLLSPHTCETRALRATLYRFLYWFWEKNRPFWSLVQLRPAK